MSEPYLTEEEDERVRRGFMLPKFVPDTALQIKLDSLFGSDKFNLDNLVMGKSDHNIALLPSESVEKEEKEKPDE